MTIRDELDHTRRVWKGHDRLIELQEQFERAPDAASRAVVAERIADRIESQAEHLAASWLARRSTALPSPEGLRAAAADWRQQAERLWAEAAAEADR